MTVIIHDTTIITCDDAGAVLADAAVAIEGNRIAAVGPSDEVVARFPSAERVSGRGKAVAPGLANCHTHLARVLARGLFEDQNAPNTPPYSRRGYLRIPSLLPEERDAMVQLGALEAIRSGTTLVMEVSSQIEQYADLLISTGLRLVLAEQISDRPAGSMVGEPDLISFDPSRGGEGLQRIEELHAARHGSEGGRIAVAAGAHAPDMVSPDLFRALAALQERLGLIATVHLNQYWGEVEAIQRTFGVRPTEHLARLGYLSNQLIASHCRCMAPAEEKLLSEAGATVCYTPAVTARCGNSARISVLEDAGARIVLGTDEFAEDMVEVLRLGILLERVRRRDSHAPTPRDAWRWGTSNGYQALGIRDGGSIRPGFLADLIVIDCVKPHLVPTIRIASGFIHQGQASDIQSVMVDGRWIMRDRTVVTIDEDGLLRRAEEFARRAWKRMLAEFPDMRQPHDLDLTHRPR